MSDTLIDLQLQVDDDEHEQLGFLSGCPGWAVYLSLGRLVDADDALYGVRQWLLIRFATTEGRITVREAHHANPAQTCSPDAPTDRLEAAVNAPGHQAIVAHRLRAAPPTIEQVRRALAAAPVPLPEPAPTGPPRPARSRPRRSAPGPRRPASRRH
jgi:hypothetical protein